MKDIIVIGGGASGMMAAIAAANIGRKVVVIEQNDRLGKKLLSTGNGRCNYTNLNQKPEFYDSDNEMFAWEIIRRFDEKKTMEFFEELGIFPKDRNGYVYPNSDQASAVADVLRIELFRLGVEVLTETRCQDVSPKGKGFLVRTNKGQLRSRKVILSAGSKASRISGSDGSGYELAKKMGHRLLPVLPALVQLRCKETFYKQISGVRIQGTVDLFSDGEKIASDTGEIQLTDYGISGIPVFQISAKAAKALYQKRQVKAVLNFMPGYTEKAIYEMLKHRILLRPEKTVAEFLIGLFPEKLIVLWITLLKTDKKKYCTFLSDEELRKLAACITNFETVITKTNPFEQAQICCGGVNTQEVSKDTLESLVVPGVYFCGEILDVNGLCGGYNLQWAWSSGYLAGREAAYASH